jgi:hypothetical protein
MRLTLSLLLTLAALNWTGCDQGKESGSSASEPKPAPRAKDPANRRQSRLAWHRKALIEAYRAVGRRRSAWDAPAERALELFAEVRSFSTPGSGVRDQLKTSVRDAINAGCDDPMIGYLNAVYVAKEDGGDPVEIARATRDAANKLNVSGYNSLAKFYGCLRAAEASTVDIGPDGTLPEYLQDLRYSTTTNLVSLLRDRTTPVDDIYQATHEWLPTAKRSARQFPEDLKFVEPELQRWGDEPLILLARAECATDAAWNARGGDYADTVTDEGWKVFAQRLNTSRDLLEKAWKSDASEPRIANNMIRVAVGLGLKRPEMEEWFERAMRLDTNNINACEAKLVYLKPQWHGSPEELIAFGRQCVSNPWGGKVPLTLVDAHAALASLLPEPRQDDYWKHDAVWRDIESSFERFFSLNPEAVDYRHNYAWYAFHAGRWKTFQQQLPLFGRTNYAYFGGKKEFDKMLATAREGARAH